MAIDTAQVADASHVLPFDRRYDDGSVRFRFTVDAQMDAEIVVAGRGTIAGAERMIDFLNEAVALLGADHGSRIFFDVSEVRGSPLRSQFMFGRWLLRHRRVVSRCAIFGAQPWERRLATVTASIAGFSNLRFFEHEATARTWLHAPH